MNLLRRVCQSLIAISLVAMMAALVEVASATVATAAPKDPDWLRGQCTAEIVDLCRAAATNNPEAQFKLAEYYRDHNDLTALDGKPVDSERRYGEWIEKSAKNGYAEAQYAFGERNRNSRNYPLAVDWLYLAANHPTTPIANARYALGLLFFNGQGVKKDLNEARSLMLLAADQGHAQARAFLTFRKAQLVETKVSFGEVAKLEDQIKIDTKIPQQKSLNAALPSVNFAADAATAKTSAQSSTTRAALPAIYRVEAGASQFTDDSNSAEFLALKKLAQSGDVQAQKQLARRYAFGDGIAQNSTEAKFWYLQAANRGDVETQLGLASIFFDGTGTAKDYAQAFLWFNKAAKQGDSKALSYLAALYENGWGVAKDLSKSRANYQTAADKGVDFAAYNVAVMYHNGIGGDKNLDIAAKYFGIAAEAGITAAKYEYGMRLRDGIGISSNAKKSVPWLRQSAEAGYAQAYYPLGLALETGSGTDKNDREALVWYQRSLVARVNSAPVYFQLALMYRDGRSVQPNIDKAIGILDGFGQSNDYAAIKPWAISELLNIAEILTSGNGVVKRDLDKAIAILNNYAASNEDARNSLIELAINLANGKNVTQNPKLAVTLLNSIVDKYPELSGENKDRAHIELHRLAIKLLEVSPRGSSEQQLAIDVLNSLARNEKLQSTAAGKILVLNAALTLVREFAEGKHLEKNITQYLVFAEFAARMGDVPTMNELANRYRFGHEVPRNDQKVIGFLAMITKVPAGTDEAMKLKGEAFNQLGLIYRDGQGVKADFDTAAKNFAFAMRNGNKNARESLSELAEQGNQKAKKYLSLVDSPTNSILLTRVQLKGSAIHAFRDGDGSLIVSAGKGGVVRLGIDGRVTTLLTTAQLNNGNAYQTFRDRDGSLIVSAWSDGLGGGVVRLGLDGRVTTLLTRVLLNNGNARHTFRDGDGSLIVSADKGGVVRLGVDGRVTTLLEGFVWHAFRDGDGSLIVSAAKDGSGGEVVRLGFFGHLSTLLPRAQLNGGSAYHSFRDDDGSLIVSSGFGGLVRLGVDGKVSTLLNNVQLNYGDAFHSFRDNDGNLIVSEGDGGVVRVNFEIK